MSRKQQKPAGQEWFYHAPEKVVHRDAVAVPPSSQIPGLNGEVIHDYEDEPQRGFFRDTDSEYVRLAKMGGRQDLLKMPDAKPKTVEAKPYARSEWFYLEDNRRNDEEEKMRAMGPQHPQGGGEGGQWDFRLPEYMVHEAHKPSGQGVSFAPEVMRPAGIPPSAGSTRHPFAHSDETVWQREGAAIRDKTVKIPNIKRAGYGVRSGKHTGSAKQQPMPEVRRKPIASAHQEERDIIDRHHYQPMAKPQYEDKNPAMSKIMSHGYVSEWHDEQSKWREDQDVDYARFQQQHGNPGPGQDAPGGGYQTEYKQYMEDTVNQRHHQHEQQMPPSRERSAQPHREPEPEMKGAQELEKEMFKLSKFKNVPSRVDSRRPDWLTSPNAQGPISAGVGH